MSRAKFQIEGARLEMASRPSSGTVIIERGGPGVTPLFSVRPFRRWRLYTVPLADVASMVVRAIIQAEVREKKKARAARRRAR